jgi:hypothetical protein
MRRCSEPVWRCLVDPAGAFSPAAASGIRIVQAVAKAANGRDHILPEFLSDAGHEHLDRVRVAIEILVVDMLDQLGPADDLALVVEQIGQELVFLRGQLDRFAGLVTLPERVSSRTSPAISSDEALPDARRMSARSRRSAPRSGTAWRR